MGLEYGSERTKYEDVQGAFNDDDDDAPDASELFGDAPPEGGRRKARSSREEEDDDDDRDEDDPEAEGSDDAEDDEEDDDDGDEDVPDLDDYEDDEEIEDRRKPARVPPKKRAKGSPGQPAGDDAEDDDPLDGVQLDEETTDPNLVKGVRKLADTVKDLRKQIKTREAREAQRSQQEIVDRFDGWIRNQDAELFGRAEHTQLNPKGRYLRNRAAVLKAVGRTVLGYEASGEPVPAWEQVFREALSLTKASTGENKNKDTGEQRRRDKKVRERANQKLPGASRKRRGPAATASSPEKEARSWFANEYRKMTRGRR